MNNYQRRCRAEMIDVYDVLTAFQVNDPAIAHAIKKLLAPGQRGVKSVVEDLIEAQQSIVRAIELQREKEDGSFTTSILHESSCFEREEDAAISRTLANLSDLARSDNNITSSNQTDTPDNEADN